MADGGDDRRVRRTRQLLHRALGSLIHEKPFDDIVVKEILARADVGRSTFYTHYRDKEDLLVSALREAIATGSPRPGAELDPTERVLRFSLPLLTHIEHALRAGEMKLGPAAQTGMHERLREVIVEFVTDELHRVQPRGIPARGVPDALLARHVADAFLLVIDWWVNGNESRPARDVDAQFRALLGPVLGATLGP